MDIHFSKYHGTGNDFILIDDRKESFDIANSDLIKEMCSRRFGIGADGLILLRNRDGYDFQMIYYNSDGNQSSMCGNGGRCIVQFARSLGIFQETCKFLAIDGPHTAMMAGDHKVKLKMGSVGNIERDGHAVVLDTGSPHYVVQVENVDSIDVKVQGRRIRNSVKYKEQGINVNFVEYLKDRLRVATYERGVEDETYSCGTGVTAAALAIYSLDSSKTQSPVCIETKGGILSVYFEQKSENTFSNIWLEGPVVKTYDGVWKI